MKKLVTMVAILGVLAFCLPSYGEILIYKVSTSGKVINDDSGEFELNAMQGGYLVIDQDDDDSGFNDVVFILYGKEHDGDKVQMYFVHSDDSDVYNYYDWYDFSPNEPKYIYLDLYSYYYDEYVLEGLIIGQFKSTNIGDDYKWLVPKSYDGGVALWYDMFNEDDLYGSGNISLRLQEGWTQQANKSGADLEDAVDYITGVLSALGYDDWGNEADW
jgi:hypothetical protein